MSRKLVEASKYVNLFYEEDKQLIIAVWLPTTKELYGNDEYKDTCLLTGEICVKYKPKAWIVDNRTLFYTIDNDTRAWIDEELTPKFKEAGLEKMAIVHAEGSGEQLFENTSMQLLMEEQNTRMAWQTQFFNSEEEARFWLFD